MTRLQHICWRWSDAVYSLIEWVRIRAAERRVHTRDTDPDDAAFDEAWSRDLADREPDTWDKLDRPGRMACMIAVIAAAVWMICGSIPR